MNSIWQKYIKPLKSTSSKSQEHDTVIIGGGIAGIVCAFKLFESGHNVTIIEAEKILRGVTANTTAHVTALQTIYHDIPTKKKRRLYFESQIDAIDEIEKLVEKYKLNCEFKRLDSFAFAKNPEQKTLKKEYKLLRKAGAADVRYIPNKKMPFGIYDAILLAGQAQFNPILFCQGLIDYMLNSSGTNKGSLTIIENSRVKKVGLLRKVIKTEKQVFRYNRVILATGFPIVNIRGLYSFKMYKSSSYSVCASGGATFDGIYNSMAGDGLTYRCCSDGTIIGGLDHRTGRWKCETYFDILKRESKPFGEITHKWSANDCMTFDSIPFAGRMFRLCARNTYMISGFGKWGMANSIVCANIVADIINKRKNPYRRIFKPTRFYNIKVWLKAIENFLIDGLGLVQGLFSSKKRRCPHMGCRLKFNPNTKTYDCPCHGSRLASSGEIIVSPSAHANSSLKNDN